jgi:glycosyltransferase involved in cell wall biosynthesis
MVDRSRPRVALVHDWLTGMRGGEKVLEEIGELFPTAPIYTLFHFPGSVSEKLEGHPIHTSFLQKAPGIRRHYRRYLPLFPQAIESFDLTAYDVVVSTSHCVAKGVISGPRSFHLCYCHTPMRYAWDQEHAYFPRRSGSAARLRGLILSALRSWDVTSAMRVDQFVANSSFVAQRIRRYYDREAVVLHPPIDTDFFYPTDTERKDFVLVVSALAPYKRIELAIEACRELGRELRIVGTGPEKKGLEALAGESVRFLGWVDTEQLRDLYREAACLLQPGIEDFGMAVVEALACGCPIAALGKGGVLDIVESGVHGVLYPEQDNTDAVAEAIDKSVELRSNSLDQRERAEEFSTRRFQGRFRELLATHVSTEENTGS